MEDNHAETYIGNLGNFLLSLSEITDIANPEVSYQLRTAFIAVEITTYAGVNESMIEDIFAASQYMM